MQKVGKNDSFVYTHEVRLYKNGQRLVKKRQVSAREYIESMEQRRPSCKDIKKFRQCFIYEQNYFQVETLLNVDMQPSFLKIETSKNHSQIVLPKFVTVLKEVTMDNAYDRAECARNGWKLPEEDKKEIIAVQKRLQKEMTMKKDADK